MEAREPEYEVVVTTNAMVPMRDGVRLATDIHRPAKRGVAVSEPLPVILQRTPYNKAQLDTAELCQYFVQRGYVFAVQDCRGCFASEGELYFLAQEPNDGYDAVEWIAQQPWCNGKIGTMGTSYLAWTQSALATQAPPHLTCMFPNMGGANAYTSSVRQGGALELRFIAWAFWHSATNTNAALKHSPHVDAALNGIDFGEWLKRWPIKRGQTQLKLVPSYEKWAFDLLDNMRYDDYWKQPGFGLQEHWDRHSDVPMHFTGGWYDSYTRATLENFVGLSEMKESYVRVTMGPWTHGTVTTERSYSGDVEFGPDAALDSFDELHLRWFDRWLKQDDNEVDREPPVGIFVMGGGDGRKTAEGRMFHGGRWRSESEWPLARGRYASYYIHGDGTLSTEPPKEQSSSTTYVYDPRNPVPTVGANVSSLSGMGKLPRQLKHPAIPYADGANAQQRYDIVLAGAFDQQERPDFFGCEPPYLPLGSRHDVLVFQTAPLERDLEVTGPIEVKLWISSTAPDTDFTAKLIDVYPSSEDYPEGYAMNLTDSIMRARFRKSWERPEPLEPGEVAEITIVPYPTSNLFKAGHRIRLDISSSNFPRFDPNSNTGAERASDGRKRTAENTVHHDAPRPSHIVLPVIPVE